MVNKDAEPHNQLSAILYFLHSIPDVYSESVYESLEKELGRLHYQERLAEFKEASKWALEHADFDFKKYADVRQDNERVLYFVRSVDCILDDLIKKG